MEVDILNRRIAARHCAGDAHPGSISRRLCGGPRSAQDYVELARLFHALIVSDVPAMSDQHNDLARRFINLVDALYDRRVKLILSARGFPWTSFTRGRVLAFEFQRTHSRLVEMAVLDYLGAASPGLTARRSQGRSQDGRGNDQALE